MSPKKLRKAIEEADSAVLVPGLLSALAPILPTTKEAAICLDHHMGDTGFSDLSDRELAQLFVVEMAAIPRVNQRVESLIARSDFEMKSSVIHNVCSLLELRHPNQHCSCSDDKVAFCHLQRTYYKHQVKGNYTSMLTIKNLTVN